MNKSASLLIFIMLSLQGMSQNVGIGTTTPTQKLDVNGNINVNGKITANGTAGQPGEVLRTNTSGNMEWGPGGGCAFSNFTAFNFFDGNWTVPAGVTKVVIEAWGGGAGGMQHAGGGGGGYIRAQFDVNAGATLSVVVGTRGTGGLTTGSAGGSSSVTVPAVGGTYTVMASGGSVSQNVGNVTYAYGGTYSVNPGYANYTGTEGSPGLPNQYIYTEVSAGVFQQIVMGGKGGDGGNTLNTGAAGSYSFPNIIYVAANGLDKGGGGGGGIPSVSGGGNGGRGKVIIWY